MLFRKMSRPRKTPKKAVLKENDNPICTSIVPSYPKGRDAVWPSDYLGGGSFGKVFKRHYKGKDVAVKFIPMDHFEINEIEIMRLADNQNPYVPKIIDFCKGTSFHYTTEIPTYIVITELLFKPIGSHTGMEDDDFHAIQYEQNPPLYLGKENISLRNALRLMEQLCEGLMRLHTIGVAHQDIKPENIMLDRDPATDANWLIKYIDYGVSCVSFKTLPPEAKNVKTCLGPKTVAGTIMYFPFEIRFPEDFPTPWHPFQASTRHDIWSLGLVLLEQFTKSVFFMALEPYKWIKFNVQPQLSTAPSITPKLPIPFYNQPTARDCKSTTGCKTLSWIAEHPVKSAVFKLNATDSQEKTVQTIQALLINMLELDTEKRINAMDIFRSLPRPIR